MKLLENAMRDTMTSPPAFPADSPLASQWVNGKGRFLIDGFPRKMDQALKFDETVSDSQHPDGSSFWITSLTRKYHGSVQNSPADRIGCRVIIRPVYQHHRRSHAGAPIGAGQDERQGR